MSVDIVWQLTAATSVATCTAAGLIARRFLQRFDERKQPRR